MEWLCSRREQIVVVIWCHCDFYSFVLQLLDYMYFLVWVVHRRTGGLVLTQRRLVFSVVVFNLLVARMVFIPWVARKISWVVFQFIDFMSRWLFLYKKIAFFQLFYEFYTINEGNWGVMRFFCVTWGSVRILIHILCNSKIVCYVLFGLFYSF